MPTIQQRRVVVGSRRYDPDAVNYMARVEAAGASWGGNKRAVNDLFLALKSGSNPTPSGITHLAALKNGCLLAGMGFEGVLVPLMPGWATPTNVGFVSGDHNRLTGIKGTGVAYLGSGLLNDVLPQNNRSLGVLVTANDLTETGVVGMIGENGTAMQATHVGRDNTAGTYFSRCSGGSSANTAVVAKTAGVFGVSRSGGASYMRRYGNTGAVSHVVASAVPLAVPTYVFSRATTFPTKDRLAAYWYGEAVDLDYLHTIFSAYQAALV